MGSRGVFYCGGMWRLGALRGMASDSGFGFPGSCAAAAQVFAIVVAALLFSQGFTSPKRKRGALEDQIDAVLAVVRGGGPSAVARLP